MPVHECVVMITSFAFSSLCYSGMRLQNTINKITSTYAFKQKFDPIYRRETSNQRNITILYYNLQCTFLTFTYVFKMKSSGISS